MRSLHRKYRKTSTRFGARNLRMSAGRHMGLPSPNKSSWNCSNSNRRQMSKSWSCIVQSKARELPCRWSSRCIQLARRPCHWRPLSRKRPYPNRWAHQTLGHLARTTHSHYKSYLSCNHLKCCTSRHRDWRQCTSCCCHTPSCSQYSQRRTGCKARELCRSTCRCDKLACPYSRCPWCKLHLDRWASCYPLNSSELAVAD